MDFSATSFKLGITIWNTTVLSGAVTEAGITAFGIGTERNATGVVFSDAPDGAFVDAEVASDPDQTLSRRLQADRCLCLCPGLQRRDRKSVV